MASKLMCVLYVSFGIIGDIKRLRMTHRQGFYVLMKIGEIIPSQIVLKSSSKTQLMMQMAIMYNVIEMLLQFLQFHQNVTRGAEYNIITKESLEIASTGICG